MSGNTERIDLVNIGLVVISLALAIWLPFKLFLFSYAFLGPLHYMTEMNWLNEHNFFIKQSKKWIYALCGICFLITIPTIFGYLDGEFNLTLSKTLAPFAHYYYHLLLGSFLLSLSLLLFKQVKHILISLLPILLIVLWFNKEQFQFLVFTGLFLPTIVHIYLFTLFFVIFGVKKSGSKNGKWLAWAIVVVPFIIAFLPIEDNVYKISKSIIHPLQSVNIGNITSAMAYLMDTSGAKSFNPLSALGVKIQIFITFAYTYHYLNWFSKTSIIGWGKKLKGTKAIVILGIGVISSITYIIDYKLGYTLLFFLSFMHVVLEFPLNFVSIKGIFSKS